jgi:hypothetical protein
MVKKLLFSVTAAILNGGRGCQDTILKGTQSARFGLIWFSGFRGKDLNMIFYQNMPNLHNWYKSALLPSLGIRRPSVVIVNFHI